MENTIAETGTVPPSSLYDRKFNAAALIDWCNTADLDTAFIDAPHPWQNSYIESSMPNSERNNSPGKSWTL